MNVQEVEARMVARITGLEEEESRMQEWLECLRRVGEIAAQWQLKPEKEILAIETSSIEKEERVGRVAPLPEEESARECTEQPYEETAVRHERPQLDEDLFEELRRRLKGESKPKSEPAFGSGLLSVASA